MNLVSKLLATIVFSAAQLALAALPARYANTTWFGEHHSKDADIEVLVEFTEDRAKMTMNWEDNEPEVIEGPAKYVEAGTVIDGNPLVKPAIIIGNGPEESVALIITDENTMMADELPLKKVTK